MSDIFSEELKLIKNEEIRKFTEFILSKRPLYFDEVTSSSTGKYHPPQSNEKPGGLINHTRSVCYFAQIFCRAYNTTGEETDLILASCLLHDLVKWGVGVQQKHTTKHHAKDASDYIRILSKNYTGIIKLEHIDTIRANIMAHMGRWSDWNPKFPEDFSRQQQVVHLSDMASAGKEVHLLFLEQELRIG